MANREFLNNPNGQNSSGEIEALFDSVVQFNYGELQNNYVGQDLYGQDQLGLSQDGRAVREVFAHTGLVGRSDLKEDIVRQQYSTANYYTGSLVIGGAYRIGKAHFYHLEEQEDRPMEMRFATQNVGDLGRLQASTEEYQRLRNYVNGETWVGGFHKTPLFVDGTTDKLQLLGRPDYFSGAAASNTIDWFGGVGYAMIEMANNFGDNFVTQEGERSQIYVTDILTGSYSNADLLTAYYTSEFNIDTNNPNSPSPLKLVYQGGGRQRIIPNIYVSHELQKANANDVIFMYNGWQDDIKEYTRFAGKIDSWTEGEAQFQKVVTQIRTRRGHYFFDNRRLLLVRGPRVN